MPKMFKTIFPIFLIGYQLHLLEVEQPSCLEGYGFYGERLRERLQCSHSQIPLNIQFTCLDFLFT